MIVVARFTPASLRKCVKIRRFCPPNNFSENASKGRRVKLFHRPSLIFFICALPPSALVGQTGAAACTTAGKNLAAVGSRHSLAEAVLLGALELLGLIGARSSHCQYTSCKEYRRPKRATLTRRRVSFPTPAVDKKRRRILRRTGYYTLSVRFLSIKISFLFRTRQTVFAALFPHKLLCSAAFCFPFVIVLYIRICIAFYPRFCYNLKRKFSAFLLPLTFYEGSFSF